MKVIDVADISKSFGNNKILDDVSFTIGKGSIFGFFGRNGAGKTTTLRIMLGLLEADGGDARIFGKRYSENREIRKRTGVLLEEAGTYDLMTAVQNLDYYARIYEIPDKEKRIERVLNLANLESKRDMKVGRFSTGMKKKMGLSRALLHEPDLLLLDEPTAGLDPEALIDFRDLFLNLSCKEGITIFMNTHNLDEAQKVCTHIAILHDKKIALSGEMKDVLVKYGTDSLEEVYLDVVRRRKK